MAFEDSDIYQAILDGDLAALGCSVQEQDVNQRDNSGKSFLHICIELGQTELVEYLAQKVFLGFRDSNGHTALDLAARYRMTEVESQLIRQVAGMQDSDDTQSLLQLFRAGWRAWPSIQSQTNSDDTEPSPGHLCQMKILKLQNRVDTIHEAVHHGQLTQLQEAVSDEGLVLVSDHTGLPPLQKAVLFENLSVVQFLSHGFPNSVNHPDHMGRTALHYAAAYHEYQDNILYKQLLKAGANEDISDLHGFKPTDFLMDAGLFSIDLMREEIKSRLSRPPKDYSSQVSCECSRNSSSIHESTSTNHTIKRWKAIVSVASFARNNYRQPKRTTPFEDTRLYEAIITNDIYGLRYLLSKGEDVNQHNLEGWSYLHLAVAHYVSPPLLSLLLNHISPAVRDSDGMTPLEMAVLKYKNSSLTKIFLDVIIGRIICGDISALQGLVQDGWQHWPDEDHVTECLQSHLTLEMKQFLSSVHQSMSDIREVHKAAILHQELHTDLSPLLDIDTGVITLNSVGLSLVHICVIFYNIGLLKQLLHNFPFTVNLKDSVGRTPLHYAASLDDDDYMYCMLRSASARDDEEDLWGMRPCDYTTDKNKLVSPRIQERIRDKIYNPLELKLPWPTCLLSATIESSKVYDAIKTNDVAALETLLMDPSTNITQRDSEGRGYLHHALLTGADLPTIKALLTRIDLAHRDNKGNTVMDLLMSGSYPDGVQEAVECRVRELILGDGVENDKEINRLLLAGWCYWPVSKEEAHRQSEEAGHRLDKLTEQKDRVAELHKAVQDGRVKDINRLLDSKLLVTAADQTGLPPLHKAVVYQQEQIVQYFLSNFAASLDTKDHMGRTALHYAATLTEENILYKMLTDAGADHNATDLMGKTPKDYLEKPGALSISDISKKMPEVSTSPVMSTTIQNSDSSKRGETFVSKPNEHTVNTSSSSACPLSSSSAETTEISEATPVKMNMPCSSHQQSTPPTSTDGKYLAQHLGAVLTQALAEIVEIQPSDPIEYLGQWLYKYRWNSDD